MKKILSAVIGAAALLALLLVAAPRLTGRETEAEAGAAAPTTEAMLSPQPLTLDGESNTAEPRSALAETAAPAAAGTARELSFAEDYEEVLAALMAVTSARGGDRGIILEEDAEAAAAEPSAAADTAVNASGGSGGGKDYSGTNVQVEGIDEGDVVKTDGQYLYILRGLDLTIAEAAGADTRVLSKIQVGIEQDDSETDYYGYTSKRPRELFVDGDRLALLCSYSSYRSWQEDGDWHWEDESYTCVDIYDIAGRSAPRLLNSLGQDGYLLGSRLLNGTLYLVTDYGVWNFEEDEPSSYVPCFYRNGIREAMPAADICLCPEGNSTRYAVVGSYDLAGASAGPSQSVLGGGSELYMSSGSIYVAGSGYTETKSEPRQESIYTVVDYSYAASTRIFRFDLDTGLALTATGEAPGTLDSQFSMDEYEDTLRLVTTLDSYSYTSYTDEERGFVNTVWPEESRQSTNGLYILDGELNIMGRVEDLAPGERVYSARFSGNTAYFCTFRTVDPLFAVDLSDPAAPQVLSALKISGFSDYLHPWAENRLLGAGYEADAETGLTEAVKLVMFDTGDRTDVTDISSLITDCLYSPALGNHKAFLISFSRNLIAFPGDESYYIFSYDEDAGFFQRAKVPLGDWSWESRGFYIGNELYIAGPDTVSVISLADFSLTAEIPL